VDELWDMPEEHARIMWKWGGFGDEHDFPGVRVMLARVCRGVTPAARRMLARHFASLAVRRGPLAALALLRLVLPLVPAPVVQRPGGAVRRLLPQAGHGAVAPSRGSPLRVLHMCPVMPGAPPT
jgi:hypothetical protein